MAYSALRFNTNALYQGINQTAHGYTTPGLIARYNGSSFVLADASTEANAQMVGMISNIQDANSFFITQIGFVSGLTTIPAEGGTYTPGTLYYLSTDVGDGLLTAVKPSGASEIVCPCFIAYTATSGFFFTNVGTTVSADTESWTQVTVDTLMVANNGYTTNSSSNLNMTLPAAMTYGQTIRIASQDIGGFKVIQPANVTIIFGIENTTVGAGGYIQTLTEGSVVELLCVEDSGPGYELEAIRSVGDFNIV